MGLVVSFSGRIGSGKSSVTAALAAKLGWPRAGFGDYLRAEIARRGGNPESREALQDLGQALVERDPEAFCAAVLENVGYKRGDDLLVDGIRHVDIHRIITRLVSPSSARLIYLAADDTVRIERVVTRARDQHDFQRAEGHRVEAELIAALPAAADQVLSALVPLTDLIQQCAQLIAGWEGRS